MNDEEMNYINKIDDFHNEKPFMLTEEPDFLKEYPKIIVKNIETDKFKNKFRIKAREILMGAFHHQDFTINPKDALMTKEQFEAHLQQYSLKDDSLFSNIIYTDLNIYFQPLEIESYITSLECLIFEELSSFIIDTATPAYLNKILLFKTAFEQSNFQMMSKLYFGLIPAQILAKFTQTDLEAADLKKKRDLAQEQINASKDLERFIVVTDIECKKCHRKTVMTQEKQSRSADEAMTVTYTCTACAFKWARN